MSFTRLDTGEFPPLDKQTQNQFFNQNAKRNNANSNKNNNSKQLGIPTKNHALDEVVNRSISNYNDFVFGRVGLQLNEFHEDLELVLRTNYIGLRGDFILAPIESHRRWHDGREVEMISDLELSCDVWFSRVAVDLRHTLGDYYDIQASRHFEKLLDHALYLPVPVIVINCPDCDLAQVTIASAINRRFSEIKIKPLVLFQVSALKGSNPVIQESPERVDSRAISFTAPTDKSEDNESLSELSIELSDLDQSKNSSKRGSNANDSPSGWTSESGCEAGSQNSTKSTLCTWKHWNSMRSYMNSYLEIGVCLIIEDDFDDDDSELSRWIGEPVRMIIIHADQFTRTPGCNNSLQLNMRCKHFITKVARANSLKTSFVIKGRPDQDLTEYMQYLAYFANEILGRCSQIDPFIEWNDKMQLALQPLSSNLESSTYRVFEMDVMKYIKYQEAMGLAIRQLVTEEFDKNKKFVIMVLGAGRGPLVDHLIEALRKFDTTFKFIIYALDKNPSSVLALKHKHRNSWPDPIGRYETEVVQADMRSWNSGVKADLIVTELLGSFSDNELSPECIDGAWNLATPRTLSIPQDYASYISPICSYKLHQELYKLKAYEASPFEQVYVVRLSNFYQIDKPQQLFKFEHKNLHLPPSERCNERHSRLIFWSKVDTVCHGFAGYFKANLFARVGEKVVISTVENEATPNMNSWFPAFIPLEQPIQMPKGTKLELHFWRKEDSSSVWYEWVVTSPVKSRIYSQYKLSAAMSKF